MWRCSILCFRLIPDENAKDTTSDISPAPAPSKLHIDKDTINDSSKRLDMGAKHMAEITVSWDELFALKPSNEEDGRSSPHSTSTSDKTPEAAQLLDAIDGSNVDDGESKVVKEENDEDDNVENKDQKSVGSTQMTPISKRSKIDTVEKPPIEPVESGAAPATPNANDEVNLPSIDNTEMLKKKHVDETKSVDGENSEKNDLGDTAAELANSGGIGFDVNVVEQQLRSLYPEIKDLEETFTTLRRWLDFI